MWGVWEFIKWDIFERLEYMIEHEIWESGGYLKVRNIWEIIRYLQEIIVHTWESVRYLKPCEIYWACVILWRVCDIKEWDIFKRISVEILWYIERARYMINIEIRIGKDIEESDIYLTNVIY